jgi:hypothetical protein
MVIIILSLILIMKRNHPPKGIPGFALYSIFNTGRQGMYGYDPIL